VAVAAGAWVAGAGAWVAGAGAAVGVADWQAAIPASMAIANTSDNSLNIFVDISFSFYIIWVIEKFWLTFPNRISSLNYALYSIAPEPPFIQLDAFSKDMHLHF
jgi:hypothetical protein